MAANGTDQSLLMGRTRQTYNNPLQNSRAQAYGQASSPNTPYNNGDNTMYSNQFQPTPYQPTGYSGQQGNLGRYVPPMMQNGSPGSWMNGGGYSYNTPQAYTGGYSGFPPQTMYGGGNSPFAQFMSTMNNPFTGSPYGGQQGPTNVPQMNGNAQNSRGMWGGIQNTFGYGQAPQDNQVADSASQMAQQMSGGNRGGGFGPMRMDDAGQTNIPARSNLASSFGGQQVVPGQMEDNRSAWANYLGQQQQPNTGFFRNRTWLGGG